MPAVNRFCPVLYFLLLNSSDVPAQNIDISFERKQKETFPHADRLGNLSTPSTALIEISKLHSRNSAGIASPILSHRNILCVFSIYGKLKKFKNTFKTCDEKNISIIY